MSSNSTSPASANAYKVFNRPDQWDDWLDQTKWFMQQQDLWEYMDPELDTRPAEPQRPTLPSMDECIDAKEAAEPTPEQRRINRRIDFHRLFLPEYQEFSKKRDKANKYFTTYVDIKWQHYLADRPTLHSKLKALEKHVAPCEESRINALRTKFISLQKGKSPTISMSTYLHTWQLLERRMVAYRMSERSSMKHAFAKAIAIGHPSIYNLLRAAGDITANILPPLEAMIEIVRHELTVETERKPGRAANATFQDNGDDDDSAGGKSKKGGGGGGGGGSGEGAGKKKKRGDKREKRGCGFVTKKPDAEQCPSLSDCNVANAKLWPEEEDRTASWRRALDHYKQYCRKNHGFCDKAANTFSNPAAIEVWKTHHGEQVSGDGKEKFAGTTFLQVNSASRSEDRRRHWLYDNCANTHVINDVRRLDFKVTALPEESFIAAGSDDFRVVAIGTCTLEVPRVGGGAIQLQLLDVAYVPGFHTNIVSESRLHKAGLWYNGRYGKMFHNDNPIAELLRNDALPRFDVDTHLSDDLPPLVEWPRRGDGSPMSVCEAYQAHVALAASAVEKGVKDDVDTGHVGRCGPPTGPPPVAMASSYHPHERKVTPTLLHHLLGHAGADRVDHTEENVRGITVIANKHALAPKVHECTHCAVAKSARAPSRVQRERLEIPLAEMAIDLVQFGTAYNDDRWLIHAYDLETHLHFGITTPTKSQKVIMRFLHELNTFSARMGKPLRILHGDNDPSYSQNLATYLRENAIALQTTAVYTPAQDPAERAGAVISSTARTMRVASGLPQELWPEVVKAAMYLLNRTPVKEKGWKTPFELATGRKPRIGHLRVFGCRAYAHKLGANQPPRLEKLAERAHIGYLVGWDSTNIFRIWVPSLGTVLRTRDVVFDERRFYDPRDLDLLHAVTASELAAEGVLDFEEDDEEERTQFLELEHDDDLILASPPAPALAKPPVLEKPSIGKAIEPLEDLCEPTHGSAAHGSEVEADTRYPFEPPTRPQSPLSPQEPAALVEYDFPPSHDEHDLVSYEHPFDEDKMDFEPPATSGVKRVHDDDDDDDHDEKRLRALALHRAIAATCLASKLLPPDTTTSSNNLRLHISNLPKEPLHFGQVRKSHFQKQWEDAMTAEFENALKMGTFQWSSTEPSPSSSVKPLPLKWVYKYKTDSSGFVQRFKARLCARGDLQATSLDTYASTLAMRIFRLMCAIVAHFDLEMKQMDAVNAYLHAKLPHKIRLQTPPGIDAPPNCTLHLLRALYGLKESGFLWQQMLQRALEEGVGQMLVQQITTYGRSCKAEEKKRKLAGILPLCNPLAKPPPSLYPPPFVSGW